MLASKGDATQLPLEGGRAGSTTGRTAREVDLERTFEAAEAALAASVKAAGALLKATKSASAGAKVGDVRALSKTLQASHAALRELQPALTMASKVLELDFAATLRDGTFAEQVIRHAEKAGLRGVRHVHGAVLSFPVAIFPKADSLGLRYGKRSSSHLRPSVVVGELQELRKQQRASRAMIKILDAVESIYLGTTDGKVGIPVPIQRVYELLTPLPGQRDDYTDIDFVADLYTLERSGQMKSSSGKRVSFPASTSTKFRKAIRISTEDGEERLFASIRFDR